MKRSQAVIQGAPLVFEMEEAAMSAVRAVAAATVGLIDLRREANMSATLGANAWRRLSLTSDLAHQQLQAALAFHEEMSDVKVRMGCRTVANGGMDKPDSDAVNDPYFPMGAAPTPLRAVG